MVKKLTICLLVMAVTAGSSCIFSSDDKDNVQPDESGWAPEFFVTPDSVTAWFPTDWPDTATFAWNGFPEDRFEYMLEASVLTTDRYLGSVRAFLAFVHQSRGGGWQTGTFKELAADCGVAFWVEDAATGKHLKGPCIIGRPVVTAGGVRVRCSQDVREWFYGHSPARADHWAVTFRSRVLFRPRQVQRLVNYAHDEAQRDARDIRGPLSPDDYAIMDRVLKSNELDRWSPAVVINTTVVRNHVEESVAILRPGRETLAAFEVAGHRSLDMSALSQLGYTLVAPADFDASDGRVYFQLSAIGYNHARDEALVYGSYYCGRLCGQGIVFLLEKVDHYWILRGQVPLWIS